MSLDSCEAVASLSRLDVAESGLVTCSHCRTSDGQKGAVGDGHTAQTSHCSGNAGSSHVPFSTCLIRRGRLGPVRHSETGISYAAAGVQAGVSLEGRLWGTGCGWPGESASQTRPSQHCHRPGGLTPGCSLQKPGNTSHWGARSWASSGGVGSALCTCQGLGSIVDTHRPKEPTG